MRQILFRIPIPGTDHAQPLYAYGAMMCLGFLAAILVAKWRARRQGRDADTLYNIALFCFFGGVLGARLFYVIQYHDPTRGFDVWSLLRIWEGGLTYYGGLILAGGAVVAYLGITRRPILAWMDIVAPGLAMGLAFGRMGCFLNGCCHGDVTHVPWALRWPVGSIPWQHYATEFLASKGVTVSGYPGGELGAAVASTAAAWDMPLLHPAQLYSMLNALAIFAVLHVGFRWKKRDGQIFFAFVLLYGITRFLLEWVRSDEASAYLLGLPSLFARLGMEGAAGALPRLTISQNVAIVMVATGMAALVWVARRREAPAPPPNRAKAPRHRGKRS